jgi:hypothetical protein
VAVLAIAHRAGNSLAGLHAANTLGVDVIECDVHEHRGRLEVRHLKTAGALPFLWDTWELASAFAPRLGLAELLAADQRGSTFMLDLKGRGTAVPRLVASALRQVSHQQPLLVCGRYWPSIDALVEMPFVRPVFSARNQVEFGMLRRRLARNGRTYGVSVHRSLLTRAAVAELHDCAEVVMTWPVNDVASLDLLLDMGVTGMTSDEPAVLAELLRRRREPSQPGLRSE